VAARGVEVEIKLAVTGEQALRKRLRRLGFAMEQRQRERDVVFDTPDLSLRQSRRLLRLRHAAGRWLLTFKGPPKQDVRYKARKETEVEIVNGRPLEAILAELGYRPVFVYEKFRTNYRQGKADAIASLDRTPIGTFLELEGPRVWIDRTAAALGFGPADYITRSYASLYLEHCKKHGIEPANMVFERRDRPRKTPRDRR
jgi:adenylate cyclase class 2